MKARSDTTVVGHDRPMGQIDLPSRLVEGQRGRQLIEYKHDLLSHARIVENELHGFYIKLIKTSLNKVTTK